MKSKKIFLCIIVIGVIAFLAIFRTSNIEEGQEEDALSIAQIVQVNQEDKTLLIKGIGENNPIGKEGYVYCKDTEVWKLGNEESTQSEFDKLNIGDIILLEHGLVMETYPTQLHATAILSIESKIHTSASVNYSVTYFQDQKPTKVWESMEDAQYSLIRSLMHKWKSTSAAREGKDLSNLSEYYLIKEIDEKGETTELMLYKMEDEAYIQWGTATDSIVYKMGNQAYIKSGKAIQRGQCMQIDNRLYTLIEQLF